MTYRYIGSESTIADLETQTEINLSRYGERVELRDEIANETMRAETGCPLLTESDFAAIGFTEAELKKYPTPGLQLMAPPEFKAKQKAALDRLHAIRAGAPGFQAAPVTNETEIETEAVNNG